MATWSPSRLVATGRSINIAPGQVDLDDLELDEPELLELDEPELLELDESELEAVSLDPVPEDPAEPPCVPFQASRALFLPVSSGEALRRVRFLALPLQMLRR